jgi:hypothetical protein
MHLKITSEEYSYAGFCQILGLSDSALKIINTPWSRSNGCYAPPVMTPVKRDPFNYFCLAFS